MALRSICLAKSAKVSGRSIGRSTSVPPGSQRRENFLDGGIKRRRRKLQHAICRADVVSFNRVRYKIDHSAMGYGDTFRPTGGPEV